MFVNDASYEELYDALDVHKALIKEKYGSGDGIEASISLCFDMIHDPYHAVSQAFVDYGDLGMDPALLKQDVAKTNGKTNGTTSNGLNGTNGHTTGTRTPGSPVNIDIPALPKVAPVSV